MDVRDVVLRHAGRPGLGHRVALVDSVAATYEERAEVRERDLVAVGGDDRESRPVRRDATGERDLAARRRSNDAGAVERDVDPPMLPARVRVVSDGVATEQRAV
jgi:hypothetical protein